MSSDYSQLSDVAEVIDSLHKTPSYAVQGLPMVRVTDVKYGELLLDGTLKVDEQTFMEFSRRYKPNREDIVITRVGTYGITARVVETAFCLGQNTAAIIPRSINSRYLYAALNSPQLRAQIESNAVGSTQKTLSLKCINALQIPRLGEYAETKIAELIGILDDRIALLRETNATLEAIAQALFKSWFVDFDPVHARARGEQSAGLAPEVAALFPDSFEESALGMIPKGWRVGCIGHLGEVVCGKTPPTSDPDNYGEDVPFITIPDMHGYLAVTSTARSLSRKGADSQPKKYLPAGSICVSCIATPGLVVQVTESSHTNQQINSVIPHLEWGRSFPLFLLRRIGDKVRAGGSGGSVFHNLSKSSFEKIPELLPTNNLAQQYCQIVDPLVEKIIDNQRQAQTLATLRDTLLPRLISGQLRLPDAEQQLKDLAV